MPTDLHTTLKDAAPRAVQPLDLGRAKRQGARRRVARRATAATAVAASLSLVVAAGITLRADDVQIDGFDLAGPVDGSTVDWNALDLDGALDHLSAVASENAILEPGSGEYATTHAVALAWHGGGQQAAVLQVGDAAVRIDDAGRTESFERELGRLEPGAGLDEIIATLSAVPAPADGDWVGGTLPSLEPDAAALAESTHLAGQPVEPQPGSTERPDAAYALVRLGDGIRHGSTDPEVLLQAYDVLRTVGDTFVEYRGIVTDGLGRDGVGFAAHDPANDEDTVFVFDPDTGRLWGTLELIDATGTTPTIRGALALTYAVAAS